MEVDVFAALTGGTHFNRKRFGKDMEVFRPHTSPHPPVNLATAAAPASPEPQQSKKKAKKKAKKQQQESNAPPQANPSIPIFSTSTPAPASPTSPRAPSPTSHPPARPPTDEAAALLRKAHRIRTAGRAPPPPLQNFSDLAPLHHAPKALLRNLLESAFSDPTPIQRQAIPALLARRELLAIAPTGSGKTLAFLIPIVIAIKNLKRQDPDTDALRAVVLNPTHELAAQQGRVLHLLLPGTGLKGSVLTKATAAGTNFSKQDIVIGNPLRLGGLVKEGKMDLSQVRYLILDEADKLFDMGFMEQIDAVLSAASHPDITRALFSATLPEKVEEAARSVLQDPLRVTVGERNSAASTVKQRLLFVGREEGKLLAIRQLLTEGIKPPVLVFVASKERAHALHEELRYDGCRMDAIAADQSEASRRAAIDNFRSGATWVLIATDLVARGMDFAAVNTVVNYDFPASTTDYVHRVGRTGRAGRMGEAVTFFAEDDVGHLRSIANVMRASGCEVPEWMLQLKKSDQRVKVRPATTISTNPKAAGQKGKYKKRKAVMAPGQGSGKGESEGGGAGDEAVGSGESVAKKQKIMAAGGKVGRGAGPAAKRHEKAAAGAVG